MGVKIKMVTGHLTIFLTRTRDPFWSILPARILLAAVISTQIIATLIAVYGFFMTPLGWGWAGFVWGYALVWFLFNDHVTTRLQPTLHMHMRLEFKRRIAGTLSTDELLTNTKFIHNDRADFLFYFIRIKGGNVTRIDQY